jgi:hypothetical protein
MSSKKKGLVTAAVVAGAVLAGMLTIPSLVSGGSTSPSPGAESTGLSSATSTTAPSFGGGQGLVAASSAPVSGGAGSDRAAGTHGPAQTDGVPLLAPQIIKTGTVDLRVPANRLTSVYNTASNDAAEVGGYVDSSSTAGTLSGSPSATLRLRIPSASFARVVGEVAGLGKVLSESTQGDDVTGAIVNLDARIANLVAEEKSLRQLINQAGSIPQILTVENQLFSVEGQIEQLSGEQSAMADQVSFATLSVNLTAAPAPIKKAKPQAVVNAFTQGAKLALHNSAASLHGIAIAAGAAFPALVLGALALVGVAFYRRRRRSAVAVISEP